MNVEPLIHLLRSHGLEQHQDAIVAATRPCFRIHLNESGSGACGQSRIGGSPDLPASVIWPLSPQSGKAFSFIAQINFSELPQTLSNPFPTSGMLYCFAGDHTDSTSQILIYTGDAMLERAVKPKEFDIDWFDNLREYTLRFELAADIPAWTSNAEDELIERLQLSDEHVLSEIASKLRANSVGKLLGWARGIGHDITEDAYVVREVNASWMYDYKKRNQLDKSPARFWTNLLELDSSDEVNLMFGDVGYLAALIHEYDLKNWDFSKVYVSLESS